MINKIIGYLSNNPCILLVTHTNPDGDAIGSLLGLYHYFTRNGFKTYAITPNNFPSFLQWLPGAGEIVRFSESGERAVEMINEADLIFNLDFNDPERLGKMEELILRSKAVKVLIDHHPYPKKFNRLEICETTASSTAELIYLLLKQLENKPFLTLEVAEALYTGIMTDTGCFSYNSSFGQTFRITADLLESGIDRDRIFDRVYNNFSEDRMRLAGFALSKKMVVLPEYSTAYIWLTRKELDQFHHILGDTEGFVNMPLSIIGIRFSALFIEKKDRVKISFRSKGNFPANLFAAKHFKGGGHHNAAGGESEATLDETVKQFERLLTDYEDQLSHS